MFSAYQYPDYSTSDWPVFVQQNLCTSWQAQQHSIDIQDTKSIRFLDHGTTTESTIFDNSCMVKGSGISCNSLPQLNNTAGHQLRQIHVFRHTCALEYWTCYLSSLFPCWGRYIHVFWHTVCIRYAVSYYTLESNQVMQLKPWY